MSSRYSADKTADKTPKQGSIVSMISSRSADKEGAGAVGETCKCFILYGERGRNRTYNLLIKSQTQPSHWNSPPLTLLFSLSITYGLGYNWS
jgi:hypothetical protein